MSFLNCFTIDNTKIVKGLDIEQFDCINIEAPSTTRMNKAVLEFIPLFPCATADTADIAKKSLTFLNEPSRADKEDSTGVIIAFNPEEWRLCYNANLYTLLDPCGTSGHALILVNKGSKNVLSSVTNKNMTLSITAENKPAVENCRRAAVLYGAIKQRLLNKTLSKLTIPSHQAASRKTSKSARS